MMSEITIRIRYGHVLADYTGAKEAQLKLPQDISLRKLFDILSQDQLKRWIQALPSSGEIGSYLRVLLNSELISPDQYDLSLKDGDELLLIPAIAGG